MAKVKVHSTICDHVHVICAKKNGKNIDVSVDTTCENVKDISTLCVPVKEILVYAENHVCRMASRSRCTATCLVPTGILLACWIEAGLLSETLCRKSAPLQIEFCEQ